MKVADLISALQLQDPSATVVLHDPRRPGWISTLGVGEVQPVHLLATEEFGVVWLQIAAGDATVTYAGVALGAEPDHEWP